MEMPVIPVNKEVDKKKIIRKRRTKEEAQGVTNPPKYICINIYCNPKMTFCATKIFYKVFAIRVLQKIQLMAK
jgi:hypothetical protein